MNIAEVGVWKGDGARQMAVHWPDARLWLFDSFEGHAEPCEFDDAKAHPRGRYADTSVEEIRRRYPNAFIQRGYLPTVLNIVHDEIFRFVRIDVDHYWPTRWAAEFFKDRMEPGGIIEFDDYRHGECPGATKAIDEVFGRENIQDATGCFPTNAFHWMARL